MKIDVLDKGFAELMMCADTDLTVVNCARVSFGKESEWDEVPKNPCCACGLKSLFDVSQECRVNTGGNHYYQSDEKLSTRDTKLIQYLARENHWSPFAHPQIRLRVKAPIFVRTQLFKHKTGAVENEVSRRYVDDEPEFYSPDVWRGRPDKSIKQGSSGIIEHVLLEDGPGLGESPEDINEWYSRAPDYYVEMYRILLDSGLAPEQARMVLPQSTYTEWVWTGSLAFFARVYNQRSDPHAQWEAQQYAKAISEIIKPLFPVSWEALTGE